jgi:hypothetical protein
MDSPSGKVLTLRLAYPRITRKSLKGECMVGAFIVSTLNISIYLEVYEKQKEHTCIHLD